MAAGLNTDKWKSRLEHYIFSAKALHKAMVHEGFDSYFPIPIDPNGELLDGSHRVACALALGIKEVPVYLRGHYVWAPAWDDQWFIDNGLSERDMNHLMGDWCEMTG